MIDGLLTITRVSPLAKAKIRDSFSSCGNDPVTSIESGMACTKASDSSFRWHQTIQ